MLSMAVVIATIAHKDQTTRDGKPYILHPLQVMNNLDTTDAELGAIALLHDVVEDTNVSPEMLTLFGMSKRVVDAVICLTKVKGEAYNDYIERVATNQDAIKVKLADLTHNMDLSRLPKVTDRDRKRQEKYATAKLFLQEKLEESKDGE